ncbi:DNA recombination protein RmuC [Syntrophomonas erecta]
MINSVWIYILVAGVVMIITGIWAVSNRSQKVILSERVAYKDQNISELKEQLETSGQEIGNLRNQLETANLKVSAAEQKLLFMSNLESQLETKDQELTRLLQQITILREENAQLTTRLEEEIKGREEKLALIREAQTELSDAFKAMSARALQANNQAFLDLATATLEKYQENARGDLKMRQQAIYQVMQPLKESLQKVDLQIRELEKARTSAYSSLTEQVKQMATTQMQLQNETGNLVRALRTPSVRGRWGEIQLKRVVEMAGMLEYCDFYQQESRTTEEGRLRPDMVIRFPNQKQVVVDSKTPLQAYLDALEAESETVRQAKLQDHARQVRTHVNQLGSKNYWSQFKPAPEFVVLFLPGEAFFSAALEKDPSLIEYGAEQQVIIATPTTLIALLRTVAYGWKQDKINRNTELISELGKNLYDRLRVMADYFTDMRRALDRTIEAYNRAVGSFEHRVLVSARKFKELGASNGKDIEILPIIDKIPRNLSSEKWLAAGSDDQDDSC